MAGHQPVYDPYFADPFVWKAGGRYYAVGTESAPPSGQAGIPLLESPDLAQWRFAGYALEPPSGSHGWQFWAPEVAFHDGQYYIYYSCGPGEKQHLRAGVSSRPEGPYKDAGPLVDPAKVPFSIDPHPFQDADGSWFLFYAVDFLDEAGGAYAGTALVADRLVGMTRLAGEPRVILRSHFAWQRYLNPRSMYGREFDWHTLEGPCVLLRDGHYYCMYSAGNYQNETYGVDYAMAASVLGPYDDQGGAGGPRVLRTRPGLRGPGHNSVVTGPDGAQRIVYHAWNKEMTRRQMHIDLLQWTPKGPRAALPD